jgi:hypothetical protein
VICGEDSRRPSHFYEGEILNLQPKGGKAKLYQVKQVRQVVIKSKLAGEEGDA